jgi:hypothetical protein
MLFANTDRSFALLCIGRGFLWALITMINVLAVPPPFEINLRSQRNGPNFDTSISFLSNFVFFTQMVQELFKVLVLSPVS